MANISQETSDSKTAKPSPSQSGLEDMVATDSSICFIDGPRSRLIYRGYSISDLANQAAFEEVVYLLFFGKLPNRSDLSEFNKVFSSQRGLPAKFLDRMNGIPTQVHPMVVLRTLVSALAFFDEDGEDNSFPVSQKRAIRLTAQMPAIVAAWARLRKGQKPVEPRKELSHAANFLYMLSGKEPDPAFAKAFDLYLVLLADHELNASTFAARVTASTLSDYYSAITSAIGALKGPLHGGANEQVIKMLQEIGEPSKVDAWIEDAMTNKKKIMGFGHRVYKVQDPRSSLLKDMAREVCKKTGNDKLFQMLVRIEELVTAAKKLPSNVDFYSAPLLYSIGIPTDLFTPMFVISRVSGYSAHYLEQVSDNRLIRPRANYTGPMDLPFEPIERRS